MPTISFDTHAYVKELTRVGFTPEQAEIQVKTLTEALKQIEAYRSDGMASKQDVKEIELAIIELKKEIAVVRKEIAESKTETIKWVAGLLIVQAGLIIGGFFAIIQFLLK